MPQSVDPTTQKVHTPPRIVVSSIPDYLTRSKILLYPQGINDVGPPCHCHVSLSIPAVAMEDYVADLQVRWFVDYDPANPASTRPVADALLQGGLDVATVRKGPTLEVEADALGFQTDALHVIDIVIVESNGFDENSTVLPHRAVKSADGYEAATFRFVLDVRRTQSTAMPNCPRQPPSVWTCP